MASTRNVSIRQAADIYINNLTLARSANTVRTYRNGITAFLHALEQSEIVPEETQIDTLSEEAIAWFAVTLKDHSPTTERLYLTVAAGFYEFLAAENLTAINLPRMRLLIRQRGRRTGQRLPQFPRTSIEKILIYAQNLTSIPADKSDEHLRNLRDRAFLLVLADTGLRVHEACNLRRGDLDWNEQRAVIIGKGDREAVVRFSGRSMRAVKDYLSARQNLDGKTGKAITALPIFARHDKGAGNKIKPMTTATGRNIVNQRVGEALGAEAIGTITPHSFRHYFVTTVLRGSGGNLKLAQELARHQNIAVTQRYAHLSDDELDQGYGEIFDQST